MRTGSAPGMTWDEAMRHVEDLKREGHDPGYVPEHIEQMDPVAKNEELRELILAEQRNLSETRRNL